jgi:hypothetical protein
MAAVLVFRSIICPFFSAARMPMFAKLSHTRRKMSEKVKTSFAKFLILRETTHEQLFIANLLNSWERRGEGAMNVCSIACENANSKTLNTERRYKFHALV